MAYRPAQAPQGSGRSKRPLLVVDGYNVLRANARYQVLIDEHAGAGALADVRHLERDPYGHDPFVRAREALVTDVATYAQRRYEPVVVFDGAGSLSDERPNVPIAGAKVVFSRTGETADTVIERLVTQARQENRDVLLVTSDNAIKFTVGGIPVTTVSSQLLGEDIEHVDRGIQRSRSEWTGTHMTLESRLSPEQREKLWKMIGRQ